MIGLYISERLWRGAGRIARSEAVRPTLALWAVTAVIAYAIGATAVDVWSLVRGTESVALVVIDLVVDAFALAWLVTIRAILKRASEHAAYRYGRLPRVWRDFLAGRIGDPEPTARRGDHEPTSAGAAA